MSDLIEKQKTIDALIEWYGCKPVDIGSFEEIIDAVPPVDAVEVVRCKDCDWWERTDDGPYGYCHSCKHGFYSANWEISIYRRYKEDFFCADGERRIDE